MNGKKKNNSHLGCGEARFILLGLFLSQRSNFESVTPTKYSSLAFVFAAFPPPAGRAKRKLVRNSSFVPYEPWEMFSNSQQSNDMLLTTYFKPILDRLFMYPVIGTNG